MKHQPKHDHGNARPVRTITGLPMEPAYGMGIDKVHTPPPRRVHLPHLRLAELVGIIFGGIPNDGDGIIVVGRHPIPIGPRGDRTADGIARRDLLLGLAMEQIAGRVGDRERSSAVRAASLELIRAKINKMITRLP